MFSKKYALRTSHQAKGIRELLAGQNFLHFLSAGKLQSYNCGFNRFGSFGEETGGVMHKRRIFVRHVISAEILRRSIFQRSQLDVDLGGGKFEERRL